MKPFLLIASLLITAVASASTPLPLPSQLPPLRIPEPSRAERPPKGTPVAKWTRERIISLGYSTSVMLDFLANLPDASASTANTTEPGASTSPSAPRRPFRPEVEVSVLGTGQATNDASTDSEPAVITNRFNGIDRTTIAYIKGTAGGSTPRLYWTSTTDYVNFSGYPTGQQFVLPAQTTSSSDPMLSENPYAAAPGNNFPKRTYCSGIAYNSDHSFSTLDVWYTDDPGSNQWTLKQVDTANNPIFLDKPSIVTSMNPSTLGYTYVAAVAIHGDNGYHTIQLYRQTTTVGFTLVNTQFTSTGIQSPIVLVDSATGDVYLAWIDLTYSAIQVARSTNMGNTFAAPISFPTGRLLPPQYVISDNSQHYLFASSELMARTNAADNSIGVAGHQSEDDGIHTDLGFNQFYLGSQTWHWWRGIGVGNTPNDHHNQFNVALDPSGTDGTYIMSWYDTRDALDNASYCVYAERFHADGTAIDSGATNFTSGAVLANLPLVPGQPAAFVGDYQDIWEWYGTWYGGTIRMPAASQDAFVTRTAP